MTLTTTSTEGQSTDALCLVITQLQSHHVRSDQMSHTDCKTFKTEASCYCLKSPNPPHSVYEVNNRNRNSKFLCCNLRANRMQGTSFTTNACVQWFSPGIEMAFYQPVFIHACMHSIAYMHTCVHVDTLMRRPIYNFYTCTSCG